MRLQRLTFYPRKLGNQLVWLVVVSLLPVFCFAIYGSVKKQHDNLQEVSGDLLVLAKHSAVSGGQKIEGARQLLTAVVSEPKIRDGDWRSTCPSFLGAIQKNFTSYINIGILDLHGDLQCAADPANRPSNFSDRPYFRRTISNKSFSIGEYQIGRLTQRRSLNFGMPVRNAMGIMIGVAFAALDIDDLNFEKDTPLPFESRLTIIDRQGYIIASDSTHKDQIGTSIRYSLANLSLGETIPKVLEQSSFDGIDTIYGIAPVKEGQLPGLYAIVSMPRDAVTAPLTRDLVFALILIGALTCSGALLARWLARRNILTPTRRLLDKVNALANAEISYATIALKSSNELSQLTVAFDRMSSLLQARETKRDQRESEFRKIHHRLLSAQHLGKIGNWEHELRSSTVWWSDQVQEIYGLEPNKLPVSLEELHQKVYPMDRANYNAALHRLRDGQKMDIQHRIVNKTGEVRWVRHLAESSFDTEGNLLKTIGTIQDITESKKAEEAGRQNESIVSGVFEHAAAGICLVGMDNHFLKTNERFNEIVGRTWAELESLSCIELTYPEDRLFESDLVESLVSGRSVPSTWEKRYLRRDGSVVWASLSLSLQRDNFGMPLHFVGVVVDITDHKRDRETLMLETSVLQDVSFSRPLPEILARLIGGVETLIPGALGSIQPVSANGMQVVTARSPSMPAPYPETGSWETIGHQMGLAGAAEFGDEPMIVEDIEKSSLPTEYRQWALQHGLLAIWSIPVFDATHTVIATCTVFYRTTRRPTSQEVALIRRLGDITGLAIEQNAREKSLRESEERFRNTFMGAATGIAITDLDGRYLQVNATYSQMVGYSEDELKVMTVRSITHPDDIERNEQQLAEVVAGTHASFATEKRYIAKTGKLVWVRVSISALNYVDGRPKYLVRVAVDVTEQHVQQAQLRLLEEAVAHLNDIVLITEAEPFDEPGPRILFVNEAFERRTGYSRSEVIGKSPRFLQGPKTQRSELDRIGACLRQWKPVRAELINYTKSGEEFWLELDIVPLADETGWYTHWVAIERDISDRKKAEAQLHTLYREVESRVQQRTVELQVANQELEAFSYSVSHDLRSPLSVIDGFCYLLEKSESAQLSNKGKHYFRRIRESTKQMGELIDGLLSLAKLSRDELKVESVDLTSIARRVVAECKEREPNRTAEILIQESLSAQGDSRLLTAVVQNLLGNAWKFSSKSEISRIEFLAESDEDGRVTYVVHDNGAGFDMAHADKLFGTFQRLHSPGEYVGTGVGLTVVKRIVEKHGGRIWANAQVGRGASFYFTLG